MTNFDQPNNKPKYYGSGVEQIEKEIDKIEKLVEKARVLLVGDKKNLTREGGNTSYRLNVSCFDKEYLNSEIKKMKKEISENEDKLSELNIQTKIDVNLSSTTLKVLNLD